MMINKIKIVLITLIVVMVSGCVSPPKKLPKIEVFPEMYNEKPRSLLIMPPINLSTAADACFKTSCGSMQGPAEKLCFFILILFFLSKFLFQYQF